MSVKSEKILIKNGIVISMDSSRSLNERVDIAIDGTHILALGSIPGDFRPDRTIDASDCIVMPGLVNAHCHLSMVLLRNYADDLDLFTWLQKKIWPIEGKMTEEHIHDSSLMGTCELIRSGVTTFADMYFNQRETCRAIEQGGIRARIGAPFMGDDKEVDSRIPRVQALFDEWNGAAGGRIHVDSAPHSPYTLTEYGLNKAAEWSALNNNRIHIHVSESRKETEDNYKKFGISPIEYLDRTQIFDRPCYAAHCVQLNENDLDIIKSRGIYPVHNPTSNLKLGNGFAPIPEMLKRGIHPALGTDGASSNNNLNMFEELHLASIIHKGHTGDPTVVSAYEALQTATIYGAEALGVSDVCGSLTPGKEADIILIDTGKAHMQPLHDPIAALTYGAQASDVSLVMCQGRVLFEKGEVLLIDEKEAIKRSCKAWGELQNS